MDLLVSFFFLFSQHLFFQLQFFCLAWRLVNFVNFGSIKNVLRKIQNLDSKFFICLHLWELSILLKFYQALLVHVTWGILVCIFQICCQQISDRPLSRLHMNIITEIRLLNSFSHFLQINIERTTSLDLKNITYFFWTFLYCLKQIDKSFYVFFSSTLCVILFPSLRFFKKI